MNIEDEEEKFIEELARRSQVLLQNLDGKEAMKIQDQIDYAIENRQELVQSLCLKSKKYLDLGSCQIDDFDSITIGIYLNELHSNLQVMNFGNNKLTDEGLLNMLVGIQFHSNLQELYLGNNQFSVGTAIEGLATILPCLQNLKILGLGIFGTLFDKLLFLQNYKQYYLIISFSYNFLSNILQILRKNYYKNNHHFIQSIFFRSFLQQNIYLLLELGGLNIDDEGLVKICFGLSELTSLKNLQLHKNNITDEGLICIISMMLLGFGNNLETLCLGQNEEIKEEGIIKLFECLQMNQTLKCLHLNDNIMTDKSLQAINISLMANRCLEEINLGNCGIDDEGMKMLTDCLKNNTKLEYLHLWNNYLTYESGFLIQDILENYNSTLKGITLYNNDIINQELLSTIEALTQQNVYFIQTINNENFYEKKIEEMKRKYNEDLKKQKDESRSTILQGKVKAINNIPTTQTQASKSSTSIEDKSGKNTPNIKLNYPSNEKLGETTVPNNASNTSTKRPQSGILSSQKTSKIVSQPTIQNSFGQTKPPTIKSSSQVKTNPIQKNNINTKQNIVKSGIPSKSSLLKSKPNFSQGQNNQQINKGQGQKQNKNINNQYEEDDDEDIDYVPLSINIQNQISIDDEEQGDSSQENKMKKDNKSVLPQKGSSSSSAVDKKIKISKQIEDDQNDDEGDNDFQEEWLDDDEDDEKELQILEKQLERDEEILTKERNTRLEYTDEFYDEDESSKHISKYTQFEHNLHNFDPNDPKTLKWQGFFEDKKSGLLKSKLQ